MTDTVPLEQFVEAEILRLPKQEQNVCVYTFTRFSGKKTPEGKHESEEKIGFCFYGVENRECTRSDIPDLREFIEDATKFWKTVGIPHGSLPSRKSLEKRGCRIIYYPPRES